MRKQSSTRNKILATISVSGPIKIKDIAKKCDLGITGIRRHLNSLEKDNLVQVFDSDVRGLSGRPAKRYILTNEARNSFPNHFQKIATMALSVMKSQNDTAVFSKFIAEYFEPLEKNISDLMSKVSNFGSESDVLNKKANILIEALNNSGYVATISDGGLPKLRLGNCPLREIVANFPEFCEVEAKIFENNLHTAIEQVYVSAGGGSACNISLVSSDR